MWLAKQGVDIVENLAGTKYQKILSGRYPAVPGRHPSVPKIFYLDGNRYS